MLKDKILIIDDDPVTLKLTSILLSKKFEVKTSSNPLEVLNLIKIFHPLLILMDIKLANMDGVELTRQIKNNPMSMHTTIIAFSAINKEQLKEQIPKTGFNGYILKPIDINTFSSQIDKFINMAKGS